MLEQRLLAIVEALDGGKVGFDGDLYFEPAGGNGLQIRLGGDLSARCFDRSANFAISYGGDPSDAPIAAAFTAALARIKAIDAAPIDGAAADFAAAGAAVAARFAPPAPPPPKAEVIGPRPQAVDGLRRIAVVGGGTAGYFAALSLKRELADVEVTLIESKKIPIIGVGEATTTLMPPFLHLLLGIDIVELYREVKPTWKLGIKFEWGLPGDYFFVYPFGDGNPVEAYAHEGDIANQSLCALMMVADRSPIAIGDDGEPVSLLEHMPFAYHLENKSFVRFLEKHAARIGIEHVDAQITQVVPRDDGGGVDRLVLDDGREVRADLFVDASGFRSLLLEQALGSPFISYASTLFCDTAVVAEVPQRGVVQPYTTAETMEAGWCWRIPVEGEDHRGYVFSSAHLTLDQARDEMRAKNPGMGEPWTVRFRSGRHEEFWKGNTVAVGNAYGFVEPLESTALHMVIMEMRCLIHSLKERGFRQPDRAFVNRSVALHWDYLRWFLGVHYRYNQKLDNAFWRDCRASVDVSGLADMLERFRVNGPGKEGDGLPYDIPDPVFNYLGVVTMLLGQRFPCAPPRRTLMSRAEWDARVADCRALVARCLPQAEALALLRQRPEMLQALVGPRSKGWIVPRTPHAEYLKIPGFWAGTKRGTAEGAAPGQPAKADVVPYRSLLESIVPLPNPD